jgi:hypothetical protein
MAVRPGKPGRTGRANARTGKPVLDRLVLAWAKASQEGAAARMRRLSSRRNRANLICRWTSRHTMTRDHTCQEARHQPFRSDGPSDPCGHSAVSGDEPAARRISTSASGQHVRSCGDSVAFTGSHSRIATSHRVSAQLPRAEADLSYSQTQHYVMPTSPVSRLFRYRLRARLLTSGRDSGAVRDARKCVWPLPPASTLPPPHASSARPR